MSLINPFKPIRTLFLSVVFCGLCMASHAAWAKQFIGYTGKKWASDHGVLQGDCDTKNIVNLLKKEQAINTMAVVDNIEQSGLVEGTHTGGNVASGNVGLGNTAGNTATNAASNNATTPQALAALNNQTLARQINAYCFGHTLELVPAGQAVRWMNPISGHGVYLSAGPKTDTCRSFLGVHMVGNQKNKFRGEVCSQTPGVWRVQPFVPQP